MRLIFCSKLKLKYQLVEMHLKIIKLRSKKKTKKDIPKKNTKKDKLENIVTRKFKTWKSDNKVNFKVSLKKKVNFKVRK